MENATIYDIDLNNPSDELIEYIRRNHNLIAYYAPKFLTEDLSLDPDYYQLPDFDQSVILVFALKSLSIDVYEIINRITK